MLERLKRGIDKSIVSVGVQSTTYLETGKLKNKIEHVQENIIRASNELGSTIFQQWKDGKISAEYLDTVCKAIREMELEIEGYENQIEALNAEKQKVLSGEISSVANTTVCSCGNRNELGAKFCTGCGKPVTKVEEAETLRCSSCGSQMEPGTKFCSNCGAAQ